MGLLEGVEFVLDFADLELELGDGFLGGMFFGGDALFGGRWSGERLLLADGS